MCRDVLQTKAPAALHKHKFVSNQWLGEIGTCLASLRQRPQTRTKVRVCEQINPKRWRQVSKHQRWEKKLRHLHKIAFAASVTLLPLVSAAAVLFQTGNIPGGTDNVLFNPCAAEIISGTTVSGCLNTNQNIYVNFTGTETLSVNGGQAKIEADDGEFNSLLIQMANPLLGFNKITFNINTDSNDPTGIVDIIATLFAPGSAASYTQSFSVANGQNFFTVTSDSGDVIKSLSFASQVGINSVAFEDTRQVRIGVVDAPAQVCPPGTVGIPPNCVPDQNQVPEPGSLLLAGLALAGLGVASRRRQA